MHPLISFTVRGGKALFTDPLTKTDPVTYPVPPPSQIVGLIRNIYSHPGVEYRIVRIHVYTQPTYDMQKINSVKGKGPCNIEESRTQRNITFLRDVAYGVEFDVCDPIHAQRPKTRNIVSTRINRGQHYRQPYLGIREYTAFVEPGLNGTAIAQSMQLPRMPLAVHPIEDRKGKMIGNDGKRRIQSVEWFTPIMHSGVIEVPTPEWMRGLG